MRRQHPELAEGRSEGRASRLSALERKALGKARKLRARLRPLRGGLRDVPGWAMSAVAELRWLGRTPGRPHGLPKSLVVSLTSFPPRFPTLSLTLKCLLTQDVRPDRVALWIAKDDMPLLPDEVRALRGAGLSIEATGDLRSYNKIVPELRRDAEAFIVTADDDVYYPSDWLSELASSWRPRAREIPAGRVHRIVLDADGAPAPYLTWALDIKAGPASPLNLATGVGGVLYPPGSLHTDVLDERLFLRLCPTNDDLWLYFMARRAGWSARKAGRRRLFFAWPGSQRVGLQHQNVAPGGGNDLHLAALIDYFGAPFAAGPGALAEPSPAAMPPPVGRPDRPRGAGLRDL